MTEDEARTKWCPFARTKSDYIAAGSYNRETDGSVSRKAMCVGSNCMAWESLGWTREGYCNLMKRRWK